MAKDNLTLDDVRNMAADIGMERLTGEHLEQLLRATNAARARRATLRGADLTPADEPANIFRLDGEGGE
jgi:hypothetical protein